MNSPVLYAEVDGSSFERCISNHSCCVYLEYSMPQLYSACLGSSCPTATNSFVQGPMLMDLEYSDNHRKNQLVCFHYERHCIFNGNERRLQHSLNGEHIGNLLLTQSTLETFLEDLVFLLVKTLSKYIQVIIVQPARLK